MDEIELFKELIAKKKNAHELQLRIEIWTNKEERIHFAQELENVSAEIEDIENQLVEIEDKSYSRKTRASMIEQLERYVTEINKADHLLNLSRNQGLVGQNELFSGIVRDISNLITGEVFGIRIPAYLKYTTDPQDSVSIVELTEFLRNEINILRGIDSPNYLILWKYKDQFIDRINESFIE